MEAHSPYLAIIKAAARSCLSSLRVQGALLAVRVPAKNGGHEWISTAAGDADVLGAVASYDDFRQSPYGPLLEDPGKNGPLNKPSDEPSNKPSDEPLYFSLEKGQLHRTDVKTEADVTAKAMRENGSIGGLIAIRHERISDTEKGREEKNRRRSAEILSGLRAHSEQLLAVIDSLPSLFGCERESGKPESETSSRDINEAYLNSIFENSPEAIVLLDKYNRVIRVNSEFTRLFDYRPDQIDGKHIDSLIAGEELYREAGRFSDLAESGQSLTAESVRHRRDGSAVDVSIMGAPVQMNGRVIGIFGIYRDISARRKVEKALAESERRYRALIEDAPVGIFQSSSKGYFLSVNQAAADILACSSPEEVFSLYRSLARDLYVDHERREEFLSTLQQEGEVKNFDIRAYRKDGVPIWLTTNARISEKFEDGEFVIDGFLTDTTELKEATSQLQQSIRDKEILLQEVHHRVKNNMQIISSILNLERGEMEDPAVEEMLLSSQSRIRAMSLIHEKLYSSDELAVVDLEDYTQNLCREVINFTTLDENRRPELHFSLEKIYAGIDFSIPFGLIVNELILNSHKHAFEGIEEPKIFISLSSDLSTGKEKTVLEIADNGVGLPPEVDMMNSRTLGMQLIHSLVEQLNGEIRITNSGGTVYRIIFSSAES